MSTLGALVAGLVIGQIAGNVAVAAWRTIARAVRMRGLDVLVRRVRRELADERAVRRSLAGRAWQG